MPLLLAGCLHTPVPALPDALPAAWNEAPPRIASVPIDLHGWWLQFDDPMLVRTVEAALAANPGIAAAQARLHQARAQAGNVSRRYQPNVDLIARGVEEISTTDSFYQIRAELVWDLGLFGAQASAQRQVQGELAQAAAEWQAIRVAVVAETVRLYLDLRHAQRQQTLLARQAELDARLLALTETRGATGQGGPGLRLAVLTRQAHTQAEQADPTLAAARASRALAALLDLPETAPDWQAPASWPVLREGTLAQVPSDLLRSRPDVRRAEAQVQQAVGTLGQAKADLYPRIALGTSWLYAYNVTRSRNASSSSIPLITPFISLPVLDWGARRATVTAQSHGVQAALADYRQALVAGVTEVEVALAMQAHSAQRVEALTLAWRSNAELMQRAQARARAGLASTWDALEAQRQALQTERALAAAQADQALAFATLYRALGGAPLPEENVASVDTGDNA